MITIIILDMCTDSPIKSPQLQGTLIIRHITLQRACGETVHYIEKYWTSILNIKLSGIGAAYLMSLIQWVPPKCE
jgi:hypothetical protein